MNRYPFLVGILVLAVPVLAADPAWVPAGLPPPADTGPSLCPGDFLTPEQGAAVLAAAERAFPTRADWDRLSAQIRRQIQEGAGLAPWPRRTPLEPQRHSRREHDGYSVENVTFASIPGYRVAGNLYRPLGRTGPRPVVLLTHGHTGGGLGTPQGLAEHGRFAPWVQAAGATLARMGAIVLTLDMFGHGESALAVGGVSAHRTTAAMPVQVWNTRRALDFLLAEPDADATRVAVTGWSGGGTQAFLLTALDERVTVAAPVVMVSSFFFGGCPCESGRPIHRAPGHFASNAMIASLAAPRPLLLVSCGGDWTRETPRTEFPFLQRIYARQGAGGAVENVHLAGEVHDFGPAKRAAVYHFLAARLGLDAAAIAEGRVQVEPPDRLRCVDDAHPLPPGTLRDAAAVLAALQSLQAR